ncbi:MAG: carbon storage regulator [Thermoguttaceae bacterium]
MKVFLQAKDESVVINGDIMVTVLRIEGNEVVLGIDAPEWLAIEEGPELQLEVAGDSASLRAR